MDGHFIWGATARIVRSLLERLRRSLTLSSPTVTRPYCCYQTSFSTGTATMLPHSVHEPS